MHAPPTSIRQQPKWLTVTSAPFAHLCPLLPNCQPVKPKPLASAIPNQPRLSVFPSGDAASIAPPRSTSGSGPPPSSTEPRVTSPPSGLPSAGPASFRSRDEATSTAAAPSAPIELPTRPRLRGGICSLVESILSGTYSSLNESAPFVPPLFQTDHPIRTSGTCGGGDSPCTAAAQSLPAVGDGSSDSQGEANITKSDSSPVGMYSSDASSSDGDDSHRNSTAACGDAGARPPPSCASPSTAHSTSASSPPHSTGSRHRGSLIEAGTGEGAPTLAPAGRHRTRHASRPRGNHGRSHSHRQRRGDSDFGELGGDEDRGTGRPTEARGARATHVTSHVPTAAATAHTPPAAALGASPRPTPPSSSSAPPSPLLHSMHAASSSASTSLACVSASTTSSTASSLPCAATSNTPSPLPLRSSRSEAATASSSAAATGHHLRRHPRGRVPRSMSFRPHHHRWAHPQRTRSAGSGSARYSVRSHSSIRHVRRASTRSGSHHRPHHHRGRHGGNTRRHHGRRVPPPLRLLPPEPPPPFRMNSDTGMRAGTLRLERSLFELDHAIERLEHRLAANPLPVVLPMPAPAPSSVQAAAASATGGGAGTVAAEPQPATQPCAEPYFRQIPPTVSCTVSPSQQQPPPSAVAAAAAHAKSGSVAGSRATAAAGGCSCATTRRLLPSQPPPALPAAPSPPPRSAPAAPPARPSGAVPHLQAPSPLASGAANAPRDSGGGCGGAGKRAISLGDPASRAVAITARMRAPAAAPATRRETAGSLYARADVHAYPATAAAQPAAAHLPAMQLQAQGTAPVPQRQWGLPLAFLSHLAQPILRPLVVVVPAGAAPLPQQQPTKWAPSPPQQQQMQCHSLHVAPTACHPASARDHHSSESAVVGDAQARDGAGLSARRATISAGERRGPESARYSRESVPAHAARMCHRPAPPMAVAEKVAASGSASGGGERVSRCALASREVEHRCPSCGAGVDGGGGSGGGDGSVVRTAVAAVEGERGGGSDDCGGGGGGGDNARAVDSGSDNELVEGEAEAQTAPPRSMLSVRRCPAEPPLPLYKTTSTPVSSPPSQLSVSSSGASLALSTSLLSASVPAPAARPPAPMPAPAPPAPAVDRSFTGPPTARVPTPPAASAGGAAAALRVQESVVAAAPVPASGPARVTACSAVVAAYTAPTAPARAAQSYAPVWRAPAQLQSAYLLVGTG